MKKLLILFLTIVSFLFSAPHLDYMPNQVLNTDSAVNFSTVGATTFTGAFTGTATTASYANTANYATSSNYATQANTALNYFSISGGEVLTSTSSTISTALSETIISSNATNELILSLAKPNGGFIKIISVKAVASPNAIVIDGLLGNKVTVNMDAINDTLVLKYSTPNYYIIGGNSYTIE